MARIAFEEKPWYYVVIYEYYLDAVFFIDMLRIFNTPIFTDSGKLVMDRKVIAKKYLQGWFVLDLWSFYPMAFWRYRSSRVDGGKDNLVNFLNQNYQRLPRFYKIMLLL